MAFTDDLTAEVVKILKEQWQTRDGNKVPDTPELKLANDAVKLTGTVLYADLADSTGLVMLQKPGFVAEVYKCYLNCACRIIREKGGEITAFDGDRVMAVFLGDGMATRACRAALAINHAVVKILNPKVREQYPNLPAEFAIKQAVGIDMSPLFVARTGIRGANDLVWVGRAANIAAKLCALREGNFATYITNDVYAAADNSVRTSSDGKSSMWESNPQSLRNLTVHRSSWYWGL
jgi:class 3 adenylate cyclase